MVQVRIGGEAVTIAWDEWESRVREGRIPADAWVRFDPVTGGSWARAADLEMYSSLRSDAALAWRGQFLYGPPPIVTALLVGFQIRVYLLAQLPWAHAMLVSWFTNWTPPTLADGQSWRLVTMGLLHTDFFHISLNMLWLAYTGWNLERALGRASVATLYFASVLVGSLLSMFASPESQSLGASGGIFGLIAASVVFGFARPDLLPERGRRLFGTAMLPYLLLMFWSGWMNDGTDNWSHLGGLVTGGLLVLLLDPIPLQRRPQWNLGVQLSALGGGALILIGLALTGPWIHPLPDSEVVEHAFSRSEPARDPDRYDAVRFAAPAGWRARLNAAGDRAFVYPNSRRSWAVIDLVERRPIDASTLFDRWLARLQRGWPDAEVRSTDETVLAGRPGLSAWVSLTDDRGERLLAWRGATRGVFTLQEIWEVEQPRARRLEPLRDRLRASVRWDDPEELVDARRDVSALPHSPKARAAWALALLRVGELDEALRIQQELVAEAPGDARARLNLLEMVEWNPGHPHAEAIWTDALARSADGRTVVAVALGLEAAGREEQARGLLDLAWGASPGDRALRKARSQREMSTELHEVRNTPWDVEVDPVTGRARPPADVEARLATPLTLPNSADRGALLAGERAALIAAAMRWDDPEASLGPLLTLRHGRRPGGTQEEIQGLADDLERAAAGRAPAWIPDEVAEALAADPAGAASLVTATRALGPG